MPQFSSWAELERAAQKLMQEAMLSTVDKSYQDAKKNVDTFYSKPGNPTSVACPPPGYDRTGTLAEATQQEYSAAGNTAEGEIYLDTSYRYKPSGRDTQTIYNYAEESGLRGKGGFWRKTKKDVQKNIDNEFGSRFSK